jgi:hypothetical protein
MLYVTFDVWGDHPLFLRLGRTIACLAAMSAGVISAMPNAATSPKTPNQDKNTQATSPSSKSAEQQIIFKAVSMGDGQLEDGTWFHNRVYRAPDDQIVTLMRAKFASADTATKGVQNTIKGALRVSERQRLIDEHGAVLGERIVAIFPRKNSEKPLTVLMWTDGPLVRQIYSSSSEDVVLAEKTFSARSYALTHSRSVLEQLGHPDCLALFRARSPPFRFCFIKGRDILRLVCPDLPPSSAHGIIIFLM